MRNFILTLLFITCFPAAAYSDGAGRVDLEQDPGAPRPLAREPHPFTTEPGRVQIEFDFLSYARSRNGEKIDRYQFPLTLKYGPAENWDIQLLIDTFESERVRETRGQRRRVREEGFGDIALRPKINLWGNDGEGDSAFAVMPFVTIPTARHGMGSGGLEWGVLLPYATVLPMDFVLENTPLLGLIRKNDDSAYTLEVGNLVVLSRDVAESLSLFLEFEFTATAESRDPWVGMISVGPTYQFTEDLVLEAAAGVGVSSAADDVELTLTIVQRF